MHLPALEKQFQAELNQARVARFQHLAECRIGEVAVRIVQLRMIKKVVKLGAELRVKPFVDAGFLGNDHVRLTDGGPATKCMWQIAEGSECRIGNIAGVEIKIPCILLGIQKLDLSGYLRSVGIFKEEAAF